MSNTTKNIGNWNTILLLFSVLLLASHSGSAQQHPIFTQYMFNGLLLNPAYSGSHESLTLNASIRRQWAGLEGAPRTEVFSAHSPIKFSRSAAGVVVTHDQVAVLNQYKVYGTYAYHIPVSKNAKVSVGGQAGITHYRSKLADVDYTSQSGAVDPAFGNNESRLLPNLGIGAYYYNKKSYVGISLPTLINNKWDRDNFIRNTKQERHYFFTAGHVFDLNKDLKLKPNVLLRWVENGPFQYDINANLLIQKIVWVGFSYRMGDSIDGILQWNVNDQLSVGYSFGYSTSWISAVQSGSHEIALIYRVKKDKHVVLSPRHF